MSREILWVLHVLFWAKDAEELSGLLSADPGEKAAIAEDFERLIAGSDPDRAVPLWESAFADPSRTLLNADTLSVIRRYADEGVRASDPSQPADYIGYETDFCLLLLDRYGDEGDTGRHFRSFLEDHFRMLLTGVFCRMAEKAGSLCFRNLSREVLGCAGIAAAPEEPEAVPEERTLPPEPRMAAPEEPTTEPASGRQRVRTKLDVKITGLHFTEISSREADDLFTPHLVRAAGRGNCGGKCALAVREQAGCILGMTPGKAAHRQEFTGEEPGTDSGGDHQPGRNKNAADRDTDKDKYKDMTADMLSAELQQMLRPCARGLAYPQTFLRADRLRSPLLQTGERGSNNFRRISWKDAVRLTAEKVRSITDRFGPGSRYVNYATGVSAVIRGDRMAKRLLALDGGFLDYYNSYSTACIRTASLFFYGTEETGSSADTIEQTKMLILWGCNPAVTWHDPDTRRLLQNLRKKNVPIVVIDPHRSETAEALSAKWIPIRPGTDGALAAAMAWVILEEHLEDRDFLDACCLGFDAAHMPEDYLKEETWQDYLYGTRDHTAKTPAWASVITGIPAETIRQLAIQYASAKPAAILAGWGPQRHANGEQTVRSVMVLACMTGNVGIPGGCTGGSIAIPQHRKPAIPMPVNPYGKSIPSFLWTDAILRGTEMTEERDGVRGGRLDSNIRLIFNLAGNTLVNQHSDVNRTLRILQDRSRCEFIIDSDLFMTASARYADLILPGTSLFEGEHMTGPWELGNYLLYGSRSVPPLFDSRFEFEWLCALAEELGIADLSEGCGSVREWNRLLYDRIRPEEPELPDFDTFAAAGGWIFRDNPPFSAFREQRERPDKVPFPTETGKIEIFSPALARKKLPDVPALPKYVPAFEGIGDGRARKWPLQLIGWHTKRRTHSVHDNNVRMEKLEPHRLWMHPDDAAARGLSEDDEAVIWNDRGRIRMRVHVSDRIMRGVVCIPEGAWYTPAGDGTDLRGCVNVLTTSRPTPLARGNPQHSALVEVEKILDFPCLQSYNDRAHGFS